MIDTRPGGFAALKLLASLVVVACVSGCEAIGTAVAVGVAPIVVPGVVGAAVNAANPAARVDPELATAVIARVPILSKDDPRVVGGEQVGNGSAMSCERMPEDPPASEEEALVKLRLVAEQAGGNAVVLENCDARGNVSFTKNCYTWVSCQGSFVRITETDSGTAGVEPSQ